MRMLEQKVKHWNKTVYDPIIPPSFTVSWRQLSANCSFSFNLKIYHAVVFTTANVSDLSLFPTQTVPHVQNKPH